MVTYNKLKNMEENKDDIMLSDVIRVEGVTNENKKIDFEDAMKKLYAALDKYVPLEIDRCYIANDFYQNYTSKGQKYVTFDAALDLLKDATQRVLRTIDDSDHGDMTQEDKKYFEDKFRDIFDSFDFNLHKTKKGILLLNVTPSCSTATVTSGKPADVVSRDKAVADNVDEIVKHLYDPE